MNEENCFLKTYINDCNQNKSEDFCSIGIQRLKNASILPNDKLLINLPNDESKSYRCHKNSIAVYNSRHHIQRSLKYNDNQVESKNFEPVAKLCRSVTKSSFNFKEYCIFCGEKCL